MRQRQGAYTFANQYLNIVIPDEEKKFRPEWVRYIDKRPDVFYRFAFIDPAIGQHNHNDYTGIAVIEVDEKGNWYAINLSRHRLTPTQTVNKIFEIHEQFKCRVIGVESVAYQQALLYMLHEEGMRRQVVLPVKEIKRTTQSKNARIQALVPRFEWSRLFIQRGMLDFEEEYNTFPRGTHDDILDALASLEEIVSYPERKDHSNDRPTNVHDPRYESWYIKQLAAGKAPQDLRADGAWND